MTQDTNLPFVVRFVATDRGVKAESRVQGRIAFPSNRGTQPQAGECWRVTIAGENPKKSVYFLTCVEKTDETPAVTAAPQTAQRDNKRGNKQGNKQGEHRGPRHNKRHDRNDRRQGGDVIVHSTESAQPAKSTADNGFLYAPGGDSYEQAQAWMTPVKKIDMSNLAFAHAQKLAAFDPAARDIAIAMAVNMRCVEQARGEATALADALKGISENDRTVAQECYTAGKRLAAATEAKRQLQLDTLSYGRLVKSYNKQGKADDAEAKAHLAVVKGDLDQRRTVVNAEFEAATEASKDAETSRHFAFSTEEVDRARAIMSDMDIFKNAVPTHMEELKGNLKRYEDRVNELRQTSRP